MSIAVNTANTVLLSWSSRNTLLLSFGKSCCMKQYIISPLFPILSLGIILKDLGSENTMCDCFMFNGWQYISQTSNKNSVPLSSQIFLSPVWNIFNLCCNKPLLKIYITHTIIIWRNGPYYQNPLVSINMKINVFRNPSTQSHPAPITILGKIVLLLWIHWSDWLTVIRLEYVMSC